MVNEANDISPNILDFNLEKSTQPQAQLQRSRSSSLAISQQQSQQAQDRQESEKELLKVSLTATTQVLPNSAENLSWKFFEQVSSLDNQLRSDESSAISANGCHLMTSTHDANVVPVDGQHQETIVRKSNGYVISADILPQPSPDLILQQQQQQQKGNSAFKFTSPTSTFKRKKQQQQQQLNQLSINHNCNNNNNNNNNQRNITTGTTTKNHQLQAPYDHHQSPASSPNTNNCTSAKIQIRPTTNTIKQQQQQQQQPKRDDPPTMIRNTGVISSDTLGTTGTRSARTRTLPSISVRPVYAGGVDLVGDTKASGHDNRRPQKMGSSGAGGGCSSSKASAGSQSLVDGIEMHLGLIGWRKKCLYTLLALLMILIITNLVLTLWILKVMEFSTEGMGPLKIVPGGIQLTGQALIMDMLRASTIRSRHGQPIAIESSRNFSINTRDTNGMLENHLFLGHDKLECLSTGFRINDTAGRNLFSVNRNEVTIGAHALRIDGEGGAIFRESVQTPHVRAEPGRELRLESPTRQLELTAAKDINLQSRAGGIELSALEDIRLTALDGSLRLESSAILMPNLRTAQPPIPGTAQSRDHLHRVFQLCACSNGKLFLAAPHSMCAGDDTTVCR